MLDPFHRGEQFVRIHFRTTGEEERYHVKETVSTRRSHHKIGGR
jgi:hypothetical protein